MDPVSLALIAINGIRTLLSNPLLGGGSSVKAAEASELLGVLGSLLQQGDDAYDDLKAFAEQVAAIAEANREPSPTEWDFLRARSAAATDRIDSAVEELLGQEEETSPQPEPTPAPEETTEEGGEGSDPVAPV